MEMNTSFHHPSRFLSADTRSLAHGHTSSSSPSYMKSTHNYTARNCKGIFQQPGFGLSGQRFTAECAASLALVGGGLLCRGIICSHLIFISYWEIRDDKSIWSANNAPRWSVFCAQAGMWVCVKEGINNTTHGRACARRQRGATCINTEYLIKWLINMINKHKKHKEIIFKKFKMYNYSFNYSFKT